MIVDGWGDYMIVWKKNSFENQWLGISIVDVFKNNKSFLFFRTILS